MTRRLTQATYEFFDPQDKCEEAEAGRVKYLYSWRLGFGGSLIYFDHQTVQEVDLGWFADVDEAEGFIAIDSKKIVAAGGAVCVGKLN